MIGGFNHNFMHNGRLFHVQTEDHGPRNSYISTHVFEDGGIIGSLRSSYDPNGTIEGEKGSESVIRNLMIRQHKRAIRMVISGESFTASAPPSEDQEDPSAVRTPNHDKQPGPGETEDGTHESRGIQTAKDLLIELSTLEGFQGIGIFAPNGMPLACIEENNGDLKYLVKDLAESFASIQTITGEHEFAPVKRFHLVMGDSHLIACSFKGLTEDGEGGNADGLSYAVLMISEGEALANAGVIMERLVSIITREISSVESVVPHNNVRREISRHA